jgi:hypothetical protein
MACQGGASAPEITLVSVMLQVGPFVCEGVVESMRLMAIHTRPVKLAPWRAVGE